MSAASATPRVSAVQVGWAVRGVALVVVAVLFIEAPNVLSPYWTLIATQVVLAFAIAAPLNMLTGNAGQFSLGNAAFLAIGAYTGAYVVLKLDYQLPIALVVAGVIGATAGFVVGLPALRLRGAYLLMSTLAAHYLVVFAAQRFQSAQFGAAGAIFPPLQVGGVDLSSPRSMYWVILAFAAAVALVIYNVMWSGYGRAIEAVKERDLAAAACGIPVARTKLSVWALTSALIAMAGVLQAYLIGAATFEYYTLDLAIVYVAIIIVGGLGSLTGSFLGACFITLVPVAMNHLTEKYGPGVGSTDGGLLSHPLELETIVYGAIIIGFIILRPEGLVGVVRSVGRLAGRITGGGRRG
ncbi:branched-chain amino acid ABC transporter permease [Nocardioides endophyticus]|uniref:Branched-chain amino acid ABC transporter permease n=1 Tax=Nocardioides endophyticus TaxID=1353775 RepID=A0ABP8YI18_9ACTN